MKASVEVRDVTVRYASVTAVENASIEVPAGSFAALVGPSGCGKTSLLRAIAGFETPTRGTILIDGAAVAGEGVYVRPEKRRIGMMFQEGALFPHLNVSDNIAFGASREQARAMLTLVGLESLARRFPHELSGGQQQRVALARALAASPRVILLDEPFDGLDAALRVRIREEVRAILTAAQTTAILVTHDQEEALSMADQVAVMQGGRILQSATPRQIYERPETVEVAEIIGDSHLMQVVVRDGSVETPFGVFRADYPEGAAVLRLRSEDLQLVDVGPVAGRVTATHFFGHDAVDEVRLADGTSLRVRTRRSEAGVGDTVSVDLCAPSLRLFLSNGVAVDISTQRLSAVG